MEKFKSNKNSLNKEFDSKKYEDEEMYTISLLESIMKENTAKQQNIKIVYINYSLTVKK